MLILIVGKNILLLKFIIKIFKYNTLKIIIISYVDIHFFMSILLKKKKKKKIIIFIKHIYLLI